MNMKTASLALTVITLGVLTQAGRAGADELIRPLAAAEYGAVVQGSTDFYSLKEMQFVPVQGSRVAWANYVALKRDFPQLKKMSDAQIDSWIIDNYAMISVPQLKLHDVRYRSSTPSDMQKARTFLVPAFYGRAAIGIEQQPLNQGAPALIDLKGTGHTNPEKIDRQTTQYAQVLALPESERQAALDTLRTHDHSDGLMTLGEAMAEVSRQLAVQASFDLVNAKTHASHQTVESYFIISLPVQVLKKGDHSDPAAIYGRQTHFDRNSGLTLPSEPTYTDDFGGRQSSGLLSAIDFGGVVIVQPDLVKTFGDPALLKTSSAARSDAQLSNAWKYGHEAASGFLSHADRDYGFARSIINDHFSTMLSPVSNQLAAIKKDVSPKGAEIRLAKYLSGRLQSAVNIPAAAARFTTEIVKIVSHAPDKSPAVTELIEQMSPVALVSLHDSLATHPELSSRTDLIASIVNRVASLMTENHSGKILARLLDQYPTKTSVSPYTALKMAASKPLMPQDGAMKLFFKLTDTEQADVLNEILLKENKAAIAALTVELSKRSDVAASFMAQALKLKGKNVQFDALIDVVELIHGKHLGPLTCPNVFGPGKP